MELSIRTADRADAAGIADVHVASWRAGYAGVLPESVLYADDFESSRHDWWSRWELGDRQRVEVSERADGRIVGFSTFGPERARDGMPPGRGEIYAFYFHPGAWGGAAASGLFRHSEQLLRDDGYAAATLWVLAANPRARAFYEKHGWTATGVEADFDAYCEVDVPEIEYHKEFR